MTSCYKNGALTHAIGVSVRLQPWQGDLVDDTALNAVTLHCNGGATVTPHNGTFGDWSAPVYCNEGTYITGGLAKLEAQKGLNVDDTAANSLYLKCSDGKVLQPADGSFGTWQPEESCPTGNYVCGIQIRFEAYVSGGDNTALNGVKLQCCK